MTDGGQVRRALVKSAVGAARFRLTGHRAPLAVTLVLTRRCDSSCSTCGLPQVTRPELDTGEVLALVDHLARLGTTRVNLTGGEPLVRADLGAIVDRCAEHGMWTVLETNGHALPARAAELRRVHKVMIGLHGPAAVHERLTEPGAFDLATAGLAAARAAGIRVGTVTVLCRGTLDTVGWVLDLAEAQGHSAVFQLAQAHGGLASRAARRQVADAPALRRTLDELLRARQAGRPVDMSEKVLRYLASWPDYSRGSAVLPHEDLHCMAGQVSCVVDADGGVYGCLPRLDGAAPLNVRDHGFDAAFGALRDPGCQACTDTACAEANFLYNLDTPAVMEVARVGARTLFGGAA